MREDNPEFLFWDEQWQFEQWLKEQPSEAKKEFSKDLEDL